MKDNTCTVLCDRCKAVSVTITFAFLQPWEEVNEKLEKLGWQVGEQGDFCPECVKKGSGD